MNSRVENRTYLLPMVLSMILLLAFVSYFLVSEFSKEKEAMVLKERDDIFVKVFTNLEGGDGRPFQLNDDKIVTWQKDTIDGEVNFRLEYSDEENNQRDLTSRNDEIVTWKKDTIDGEVKFRLEYSNENQKSSDSANRNDSISMTIINSFSDILVDSVSELETTLFSFRDLNTQNSSNRFNFDTLFGSNTKPNFGSSESNLQDFRFLSSTKEISTFDVLKNMWFQILFSILLLCLVLFSFLMILRNLRKEKKLSEMRNDFMSNMSHELKTPVSTIGIALEALSNFDAADNPKLRKEYIDISRSEVARLDLLVDKALNLSLYEQGKFVFEDQIIQLDDELEKIVNTLKPHMANQNVGVFFEKRGDKFTVRGDRTHLINIIHNLIENGIKYSKDKPEIDIQLKEKEQHIELSIEDNGIGIAPENLNKIFDKFYRVPEGDTHNVKGHGLGLSYVKEVVEKLNGEIKVKSGLDSGSNFIISLPKEV